MGFILLKSKNAKEQGGERGTNVTSAVLHAHSLLGVLLAFLANELIMPFKMFWLPLVSSYPKT